jgi:hypothetical protein
VDLGWTVLRLWEHSTVVEMVATVQHALEEPSTVQGDEPLATTEDVA